MGESCEYNQDPYRNISAVTKASNQPPSREIQTEKRVSAAQDGIRSPSPHGRNEKELHTGYMGTGDPSRPCYVESTFWAFVNSQVSIRDPQLLNLAYTVIGVFL